MKIPYRRPEEYVPVDVRQLRPAGSYAKALKKRTHTIDALIERFGKIPPDLLVERACPTCGGTAAAPELSKDHMTLVRCGACDLVHVNPVFDEEHYREAYSSEEYQELVRDLGIASHEYRVQRFGAERVGIMAQHLDAAAGATPAYLDVGCSTGFVVEAARDRGWRAMGIDLNPSAIEFGRSRGLDLRNQALDDAGLAPGTFDAVSLFDVLEHITDPRGVLVSALRLLTPGGILFLYVPNYDSASRLLMGADAHFIWPTHHLNYYTPRTIADLLARVGMRVELLATEGLDIEDYVWYEREVHGRDVTAVEAIADRLQFFVNAGAYGKNLRALARKTEGRA